MIRKSHYVPLVRPSKPMNQSRVALISSCGVHIKSDRPMDVCHPFGDFTYRRIPSAAKNSDLIIHQLKYPHDDADLDINVIFPIETLQQLVTEGFIGGVTPHLFFSHLYYLVLGSL